MAALIDLCFRTIMSFCYIARRPTQRGMYKQHQKEVQMYSRELNYC